MQKLQELPQEKKYALLTQHKRPPQGFQFPTTFVGGCNRSFRPSWLSDHRWLAYSTQLDGAFCVPCALFNGSGVKGRLQLCVRERCKRTALAPQLHESNNGEGAAVQSRVAAYPLRPQNQPGFGSGYFCKAAPPATGTSLRSIITPVDKE